MSVVWKNVVIAGLLAAAAASQGRVEGRGAARRFVSQKYRFSMAVPAGWAVSTRLETPVFFYDPFSERFVQDHIPRGGAVITVEPQDTASRPARSATTPEAWALADTRAFATNNPAIEPLRMPTESGIARAVGCSYDEPPDSPDQQTQHSVAIFWEFNQKLFAAHLNYNANDSNGPTLEKVLLDAVRSIRPLKK